MELTEEQKAELRQKYGKALIEVETPDGVHTLVFRKPSKQIWAAFQDMAQREKVSHAASLLTLCLDCVVSPPMKEASAIFDEYPGMPVPISAELAKLAGSSPELNIKKL